MRALRYHEYGGIDQLRLEDAEAPQRSRILHAADRASVLVEVVRAALNPKDALFRKGRFRRLSGRRFPKIPGADFAGRVLEDPSGRYAPGTRVFGALDEWRFLRGTLASEVLVAPHELARLPDGVSFDDGAAVALAGLTALQALRDLARLSPGQRVLIHGASGGVGVYAIQIARRLGAEVTTITSAVNRDLARTLGATEALAYDLGEKPAAPFHAVFDVYGTLPRSKAAPWILPGGAWVGTVPSPRALWRDALSRVLPLRERLVVVRSRTADLEILGGWLAQGELVTVVDRRLPLTSFREAFERLESKRTRGKIVIEVSPS